MYLPRASDIPCLFTFLFQFHRFGHAYVLLATGLATFLADKSLSRPTYLPGAQRRITRALKDHAMAARRFVRL